MSLEDMTVSVGDYSVTGRYDSRNGSVCRETIVSFEDTTRGVGRQ